MTEEIRNSLEVTLKDDIDNLATILPGSEEHSAAVDDVVKLYKLKLEHDKMVLEFGCKQKQQSKESVEKKISFGIDIAGIVLPLGFYAWWLKKGLKFEETGTFTSTTLKNLLGRFRPTK